MNQALFTLSSAVEVLRRDEKLVVVLVRVDLPVSFYQVLGFQTHRLKERLSKYLVNATEARNVSSNPVIDGQIFLIGFMDKASFEMFKSKFRKTVGPETQPMLAAKLSSMAPEKTLGFEFEVKESAFSEAKLDSRLENLGVTGIVDYLSKLEVNDWLKKEDK
jgi:hypothetical protein